MLIHVDERNLPAAWRILEALTSSCILLGHDVSRWNKDVHNGFGRCDLAILWSSPHPNYKPALDRIRAENIPALYIQFGWSPKNCTFQVDTRATNGLASWVDEPLPESDGGTVEVPEGPLLVAMQGGMYMKSPEFSPWFGYTEDFAAHMIQHAQCDLRLRFRPLDNINPTIKEQARRRTDIRIGFDTTPDFKQSMRECCGVATVHSTCGMEALEEGLPVLCYGKAPYRHDGAVWCMDSSPLKTWCRTAQLAAGHCNLTLGKQRAVLQRLYDRQWVVQDLPHRLAVKIEEAVDAARSRAG